MRNKKGQEEIVGFVAIVVIVAVIFVIFLGISLTRQPELKKESKDIGRFLDSAAEYTSECTISYEPDYSNIRELMKNCNDGKKCLSGMKACDVFNETMNELLDAGWKTGPERPIKGLVFKTFYENNDSLKESKDEILTIQKGNCSTEYLIGAERFFSSYSGEIVYSLDICY